MIDPRDADRIRCVIESIPGLRGFALALNFATKIEIIINGTVNPEASANGICDTAEQYIKAASEEPPLRVN